MPLLYFSQNRNPRRDHVVSGELEAAHLYRNLEGVGVQVLPVLHAPRQMVPPGPIGDPVDEGVSVLGQATSPPRLPHGAMGPGIPVRQLHEQLVVWALEIFLSWELRQNLRQCRCRPGQ